MEDGVEWDAAAGSSSSLFLGAVCGVDLETYELLWCLVLGRIIWRSCGPCSISSFPISSTISIPSKNGTFLLPPFLFHFHHITYHPDPNPGSTSPPSPPPSPPPNPPNSSQPYTTSSNPSSSAVSKSTSRRHYHRRKNTCSMRL